MGEESTSGAYVFEEESLFISPGSKVLLFFLQNQEVMASKTKIYIVLEFVSVGELFERIADDGKLKENEARPHKSSNGFECYLMHCLHQVPNANTKGYDGSAADIWSCCVILLVLMARYVPFSLLKLKLLELLLFNYIQGENNYKQKIEMTAPVIPEVAPSDGLFCESSFVVSFYVPKKNQANPPPAKGLHVQKWKPVYTAVWRVCEGL